MNQPLLEIQLREFIPDTAGKDPTARKIKLRNSILDQNQDFAELAAKCKHKRLSLDVRFYLYSDTTETGRWMKDLDNMLKIVCDVLPDSMVADGTNKTGNTGLGLIKDSEDHVIYEIHCSKKLVMDMKDEGLDLKIYEWKDETITVESVTATTFNKAVRDRIPEIIRSKGGECDVTVLSDEQFLVELEKKLGEEIKEYTEGRSVDELADLLEIVYRIAELRGIDKEKLEDMRRGKVLTNGGFRNNFFLRKSW